MAEGRRIDGRYTVQQRIGRGAMGEIWRAVDDVDGSEIAMKLLHRELTNDPELVERFQREIEHSSRIVHPNAVRVLGGGHTGDGQLYMVMELLRGRPLSAIAVTEAPLQPARVARIGCQIAEGLGAAHEQGVVHRDLKPENIIVSRDMVGADVVKVFDFGLSLQSSNRKSDVRLTAMGMRLGTPAYMAPEYITEGEVDHRGDFYALGVVLFELATGTMPFDGTAYELMNRHVNVPPPTPSDHGVPVWLSNTILDLLEKEPGDRPQDAEAVVELLSPTVPGAPPALL